MLSFPPDEEPELLDEPDEPEELLLELLEELLLELLEELDALPPPLSPPPPPPQAVKPAHSNRVNRNCDVLRIGFP